MALRRWLALYGGRDPTLRRLSSAFCPELTPDRQPESNGTSEAFVKTLERDYVRITPVPDAQTARRRIAGRLEDYNENHRHSGLNMSSPCGLMRAL